MAGVRHPSPWEVLVSGSQIYAIRQAMAKAIVAYNQKFVDETTKLELKDTLGPSPPCPPPQGVAGVRPPAPWEVDVSGSVEDARGHQCDNCGKLLNP